MCRGSDSVKRDVRGGTEVSVKVTCKKKKKRFEKGAYMAIIEWNLDLRDQEEKREGGEKREGKEERTTSDRGGRCHHLITRQCPCYGQVYSQQPVKVP